MSLLSNGSDLPSHTTAFAIHEPSAVGEARRFAMGLSTAMGFDETRRGRIGIVVNELGNNLARYAKEGRLLFQQTGASSRRGLDILSVDRGPGLDTSVVMADGFTTGSTPGTGLGAVRRQSDLFDLHSQTGKGTIILARIYATDEFTKPDRYDIGSVNLPIKNESVCGDGWSVKIDEEGIQALVVDGLGHGLAANKAAMEAIHAFKVAETKSLDQMLQLIHGRLKSTRGGAVFLLKATPGNVEFSGVGNIRAVIYSQGRTKTLISQNGTAGLQIRTAKALNQAWSDQGELILTSDGIGTKWDRLEEYGLSQRHPAIMAALIERDYGRGTDDATVLVIRRAR